LLHKSRGKAKHYDVAANLAGHIPGPGRPPGCRNKYSGNLKMHVLNALANAKENDDAVGYLIQQARQDNPSPFMSLIAKCITQATESTVSGTIEVKVTYGD
jgi:hypothetical protein